jgi:hypothetical protein
MNSHYNPNPSPLDKLSAEDRERLLGWLELHPTRKVVEMAAQQPPDGLGLKTHETTLRRFAARHRAQDRAEDFGLARLFALGSAAASAATDSALTSDSPQIMDSATQSLVSDWAFEIASSPRRKLAAFKVLSRWVLKQRELEQREREINLHTSRLALDREKFEFSAARAALNHRVELGEILQNDEADEMEKINQVRSILFNRPISELPK